MLFSDVLDIHNSCTQEQAYRDILGDGFLLETNPIYKCIREFSLKIGCTYVEVYPQYLLLPFHELPKIVQSKRVPYVPHARLMREIEESRPSTFTIDDLPMPESYHLHEASHVIAEHFFGPVETHEPREKILKAILCESFANTVDALVCVPARDDIHRFFIRQNCYMHPRKKVMQAMANVTCELGFRFTFMLTFFTYVHANFLANPPGKKLMLQLQTRYATQKKLKTQLQKEIQAICAIGEKLDPRFRVTTTGNYLKQEGFDGEVHDILNFDFMAVFTENDGFGKALEALSDTLASLKN